MKVYLDVSVLIVYLFGQTKEPIRYEAVSNLFDKFHLSLLKLLGYPLQIMPLLTRSDRLAYERRFAISDASDKPHVISAYLARCNAIVSYDSHFQEATDFITALTPEEFLAHIETSV